MQAKPPSSSDPAGRNVSIGNWDADDQWGDKGVQNGSHEPHEVFHPRIWSYLHEQVAVAAKTEESDTQAHACTRALCLVISALG